jgi:putative spermidine/putrescine transport system ATP-binding protein/spermidine/putrescine transport system ATP-binding protein
LLLDEPLSSLDAKLRGAMQIELKHLHEKLGLTFILVTHDQTEAMVMSDRIVVMEDGRLVQAGTPTEVYDHPVSAYVADFLGSSNMITGRVTAVGSDGATVGFDGGEVRSLLDGASLTVGATVTVGIRPEKTRFLSDEGTAPDGHNVLLGTVRSCLFQGNVIRIEMNLDIGPETPFFVEVHLGSTANRSAMPQPGMRASVAVDPHNVSVFPMEAAR